MKKKITTAIGLSLSFGVIGCSPAIESPGDELGGPSQAEYGKALTLRDANLKRLVKNSDIVANWIGQGDSFWYRRQSDSGTEYLLVDASSGESAFLFDHEKLANELGRLSETEISSNSLPILAIAISSMDSPVTLTTTVGVFSCTIPDTACVRVSAPTIHPRHELLSPDARKVAFTKDHNIWIRDTKTRAEYSLTRDGENLYAYGRMPDTALSAISIAKTGASMPPYGTSWSPDSRKLITTRVDESTYREYPFVDWAPADGSVRPYLYNLRIPLSGDPGIAPLETLIIDTVSGESAIVDAGDGLHIPVGGLVGWSSDNRTAYFYALSSSYDHARLVEFRDGQTRTVLEESRPGGAVKFAPSPYSAPGIHLIKGGKELLWYSERSGYGHLYRYDIESGELLNEVTAGNWVVFEVIHVDDSAELIYFTAGGREPNRDPYQRHLYVASFDGSLMRLLTIDDADQNISAPPTAFIRNLFGIPLPPSKISPNGKFLVSSQSTLKSPPETILRNAQDGSIISVIEKADVEALHAAGFKEPERFRAKAADGETEIYGTIHLPLEFDPESSYSVLNATYAGPQLRSAAVGYMDAIGGPGNGDRTALASLGFIVVTIDGRGTPYRSSVFQDEGRGSGHGTVTLEDHKAAIEQLASERPYFDLSRVGIYGHSWGGYHATRGLLLHNDFYVAAVSSAGIQGYQWSYPAAEGFLGEPDFGDGITTRATDRDVPENFLEVSNSQLADRLKGKLLLAYGDLDENVSPAQTAQMVRALTLADKDYDLIVMPGANHYFDSSPYFSRRRIDYLLEHVMGVDPSNYSTE